MLLSPLLRTKETGRKLQVMTSTVHLLVSGDETGGQLAIVEHFDQPGSGVPPHVHEREDETFYVIEGSVEFFIDGGATKAGPGAVLFAPRGVPHGFVALEPSRILVHIAPAGMETMFGELAALPQGPPDMAKVFATCARYGIRFL